ncbi:ROK family protein [Bacillus sp. FJAT-28004]|uniref:ROK family protein n=1 Tax=Bacillus sp. FJAT-28004 TaxID=1679165 RepID=UPI0006B62B62|nr:ROK family protein [Bacillus sp. FJAT-28004]
MKSKTVLALDVGGTFIKTCIVENGVLLAESRKQFPALADQDANTIIDQFMTIFKLQYEFYYSSLTNNEVDNEWHIGIAFPGPFDYSQGISYVQGLSKFEAIYGMNVKKLFQERFQKSNEQWAKDLLHADILFANDAGLFALGVSIQFPQDRFISLTLGTGLGSAFIDHSRMIEQGPGVPPNGWLYNEQYRDGVVDDAFSRRGILQLAKDFDALGPGMDVKEIAESARLGNGRCREVFLEFGKRLAEMLTPYITAYKPNSIILGGQISKSYDLFGPTLQLHLSSNHVQIHTSENLLENTFLGISRMFEQREAQG